MPKLMKLVIAMVTLLSSTPVFAKSLENPYATPIALSLFSPVQFPSSNFSVTGLRLSALMGDHREVHGIDLGIIGNRTRQKFTTLAVSGVFNYNDGDGSIIGAQLAGVTNINKGNTSVYGLQAALVANLGKFTDIYGVQIGLYNRARDVYGIQFGLVNVCSNLHGLQIGLANFNAEGRFRVTPLINFGF